MAFLWDPAKYKENVRIHKVYFEDAEHIFDDPFRIKRRDDDRSETGERYQTIGKAGAVLFVIYTEEAAEDTRIISGWPRPKNGEYTMAELVRHTHTAGSGLSPEQLARIKEAEKHPIVFDEDCLELTDEQLAEFQPVNFATWEERDAAMKAARNVKADPLPAAAGK
ncbi:MAG: BrnT family toxin [Treponema sp.]|nr:BrnT family toxin [Treponema sp.]